MAAQDDFGPDISKGVRLPDGAGWRMIYTDSPCPAHAASAAKQLLKPPMVPSFTPTTANVGPLGRAFVNVEPRAWHWGQETS